MINQPPAVDHSDPNPRLVMLTPVELGRLIAGFTGRDRAIALPSGHLGLRPLEIQQVTWTWLADQTLTVGRAQTKRSARRPRVIAVPSATALLHYAHIIEAISGERHEDLDGLIEAAGAQLGTQTDARLERV